MSEQFVILVADDESGALEFYRSLFPDESEEGFSVLGSRTELSPAIGLRITARLYLDPRQLLADYREEVAKGVRHPLAVLDMHMSTEDAGLITAQGLREMDEDIDIIFSTAVSKVSPEDVRTKLRERVFFVGKPFDADEFILLVQSLVGYWRSRRDLRRQREELDRQQPLLRTLLASSHDLIFMKDKHGVYQMCSDVFAIYAGCPKEEIIGRTDHNFLSEAISEKFQNEDQQVMISKSTMTFRNEVDRPGGSSCLMETVKSPVLSERGECIGLIGVARDISARSASDEPGVTI